MSNSDTSKTNPVFDRILAEQALEVLQPLLHGGPRYTRPFTNISNYLVAMTLNAEEIELANSIVHFVVDNYFQHSQIAMWHAQEFERLGGLPHDKLSVNGSELMTRKEVTDREKITTQTLNYRMNKMGHPRPVRVEGKKQWFDRVAVMAWPDVQNKEQQEKRKKKRH